MRDVVITGVSLVTSLGCDVDDVWRRLLAGESGVRSIADDRDLSGAGVFVAAPAAPFELSRVLHDRRVCHRASKTTEMLVYCGLTAMAMANLSVADARDHHIGAMVGAGTAMAERWGFMPYEERNPRWLFDSYPNIHLSYLSRAASLTGPGETIVSACASGTQAIGRAFQAIRAGLADIVLAGSTESKLSRPFLSGFARLGMTTSAPDPDIAMRPFDRERSGFVLGEGAAMLVLESTTSAERRRVQPLARVVGYGASMDAIGLADPDSQGKAHAMIAALKDAKLEPSNITYVNAHGTSTIANDREESRALRQVFRERADRLVVNSTKSMIGHTLAASGAIEAVACVKSLLQQRVHPTRNFHVGDADCTLDYAGGGMRDLEFDYCMSNSSGIGGFNATLIFGRA